VVAADLVYLPVSSAKIFFIRSRHFPLFLRL